MVDNTLTTPQPDTDAVYHCAQQNANGTQEVSVCLTENADQRDKYIVCAPSWVIPVIFVPGVMGTNLKVKNKTKEVWRPPNSTLGGLPLLLEFFFKDAAKRQALFNSETSEVDWNGPIDPGKTGLSEQVLRARGWGSVHKDSYGEILELLHNQLLYQNILQNGSLQPYWGTTLREKPSLWGSVSSDDAALSEDEIKHLVRYRFEIWACGYNWLQSNADSGKDLEAYVDKVLATYAQHGGKQPAAQKVILVTHSMGGFVVRGMLQNPAAAKKVLGVVHGVQPASGAPAVYKRARAGFEGVASVVLGRDAPEALPVLANSPALLEMLPFANYNRGKPWLTVRSFSTSTPLLVLPSAPSKAFEDIYGSTAWYGLVPEENTPLLDPAGLVAKRLGPMKAIRPDGFEKTLIKVQQFQESITQVGYHPVTYAHFCVEGKVGVFKDRSTWASVEWLGNLPTQGAPVQTALMESDDREGKVRLAGLGTVNITPAMGYGDGTVPACSGAAPHSSMHGMDRPAQSVFIHGRYDVPDNSSLDAMRNADMDSPARKAGYEHQYSYKDERAHWATFYAIARISQLADWAQ